GKFVYHVNKKDFAPRFGIAWDPFKTGKTVVRTGFGMYHDQFSSSATELILGQNPPFQETCTSVISLGTVVPAAGCSAGSPASLRGINPHFNTPYIEQWSLDVQQLLTKNTIVTVGYYGSRGVHLIGFDEYNDLPPGV